MVAQRVRQRYIQLYSKYLVVRGAVLRVQSSNLSQSALDNSPVVDLCFIRPVSSHLSLTSILLQEEINRCGRMPELGKIGWWSNGPCGLDICNADATGSVTSRFEEAARTAVPTKRSCKPAEDS